MDAPAPKRTVHPAIKVFVGFHALMVFMWTTPHPTLAAQQQFHKNTAVENLMRPKDSLLVFNEEMLKGEMLGPEKPLGKYMMVTGLWQWWDMFAPNPADIDVYIDAEMEYADGTVAIHKYPRMYELPIPMKYFKERYRKYRERLSDDSYSWKWSHTAQRLALENYRATGKEPVRVRLWRHWMQVAPIGQPQPSEYSGYMFWDYQVDHNKLMEDAK
ncbi:MAG: hypothetical protein JSS65_07990 [Armatimonadetes bacterium]|nr:hypothetical protein [Armatimonadota bacterium]